MRGINNIETVPVDIIVKLMELLLVGGFEDCYNLFLCWARTQKTDVIVSLLKGFPLRVMYKFANAGTDADKSCFESFFRIAERLRVADAILYRSCRKILCRMGDTNAHFTVIEGLANQGHFMSMVANFSMRHFYHKQDRTTVTMQRLVDIYEHEEYDKGIVQALLDLGSIYSAAGHPEIYKIESFVGVGCPCHPSDNKILLQNECLRIRDCFFCLIGVMMNVFSEDGMNCFNVVIAK